jgi:hypothetical protein
MDADLYPYAIYTPAGLSSRSAVRQRGRRHLRKGSIDERQVEACVGRGGWSLDITVQAADPEQAIADLRDLLASFGIQPGTANALDGKLEDALAALAADDTAGACDSLRAFLNQVEAQSGKKLTTDQADQLADPANEIRALLDC